MRRELRDALDIVLEVFEAETMTLPEMKKEAENRMNAAYSIIDDIETEVNDCISNIDNSASDRKYDLEQISDKLY